MMDFFTHNSGLQPWGPHWKVAVYSNLTACKDTVTAWRTASLAWTCKWAQRDPIWAFRTPSGRNVRKGGKTFLELGKKKIFMKHENLPNLGRMWWIPWKNDRKKAYSLLLSLRLHAHTSPDQIWEWSWSRAIRMAMQIFCLVCSNAGCQLIVKNSLNF